MTKESVNLKRLGSDFENHTMSNKLFEMYKNNKLVQEIIKIKEIDEHRLYHTIRNSTENGGVSIGIYVNGIAVYLVLKNEFIYLIPNDLPKVKITDVKMYCDEMSKIIHKYDSYQNSKNEMKEKIFQHNLIYDINDVKALTDKYGKITIIDEELFIYLTEFKKKGNPRGRVDLIGVNEQGKLLFIEVKIDGAVILSSNGINKHCYDIEKYCKYAKYKKDDLNKWINQLNVMFNKNIPYIVDDNPDFIILCGYNDVSKYDVVDLISEIISEKMIDLIKNEKNIIEVEPGNPDSVKTLKKHFNDIKKNNPSLILAEVKNNKVVKSFDVGKQRINYEHKPWNTIRESLIKLTNEE